MRRRSLAGILVGLAAAGLATAARAEQDLMGYRPRHGTPSSMETAPAPEGGSQVVAVEGLIAGLTEPVDQDQLTRIYSELASVTDAAEQQRLQQLLNARLQAFSAMSEHPALPGGEVPPDGFAGTPSQPWHQPELTEQDLAAQVEMVNVGPLAAVDDLRAVDQLVQAIARLQDPLKREELLARLSQREREAEQAAATDQPAELPPDAWPHEPPSGLDQPPLETDPPATTD